MFLEQHSNFVFLLHEPLQACSIRCFTWVQKKAHHKEQNMAGCCMSIYDIWHGHMHQYYSTAEARLFDYRRRYSSQVFAFTLRTRA
jgi:hypothetical protein